MKVPHPASLRTMKNKDHQLRVLAAKGREKKLKEEKSNLNQKERETRESTRAVGELDRMIALNTSPVVNALRINYFLKVLIPMVWMLSLAMAYPYLVYFFTRDPIGGFDFKSGSHWRVDPGEEGYALLWPFLVITVLLMVYAIIWLVATTRARDHIGQQFLWLKSLPFAVIGYPGVLESDSRNRFEISIHYRGKRPENSLVSEIIKGLNKRIAYSRGNDAVDWLKIDFASDWSPTSKSGFKFHRLLHHLTERVFVPLHKDYQIDKVLVEW
jgi:hypothetical protein